MNTIGKWLTDKLGTLKEPADESSLSQAQVDIVLADVNNPARSVRRGVWLLMLGLLAFFLWALFAPLDEGVPASGIVSVDTKRKVVQHLTGGIVSAIQVREAEKVAAGQILLRLDSTLASTTHQALRQQYLSLRTQQNRLEAEQTGANRIVFHPNVIAAADADPQVREKTRLQEQLFETRRRALQGDIDILTQNSTAIRDAIRGLRAQLAAKKAQLKLVEEKLKWTGDLAREGYLPRNRWLEEQGVAAELSGAVSGLAANVSTAQSNLAETELRMTQRRQEYQREVEQLLADTTREVEVLEQRERMAAEDLARTIIRAPVDGFVVNLAVTTVGGVIPAGARLLDIVPLDEPIIVEARIAPQLIDRVHAGLAVNVRSPAFIDDPNLMLDGKVTSVSADLVMEQNDVPRHYLARVAITPEGMKTLGARVLQPGMPVEIVIKTGERTFMQYLMRPVVRRLSNAFKEA